MAMPVACALKSRCTLGSSIRFITIRNASQCRICVPINRRRARESVRVLPSGSDANQRDQRRQHLPKNGDRLFRKTRIGDADQSQDQNQAERQLPDPEAQTRASSLHAAALTCRLPAFDFDRVVLIGSLRSSGASRPLRHHRDVRCRTSPNPLDGVGNRLDRDRHVKGVGVNEARPIAHDGDVAFPEHQIAALEIWISIGARDRRAKRPPPACRCRAGRRCRRR